MNTIAERLCCRTGRWALAAVMAVLLLAGGDAISGPGQEKPGDQKPQSNGFILDWIFGTGSDKEEPVQKQVPTAPALNSFPGQPPVQMQQAVQSNSGGHGYGQAGTLQKLATDHLRPKSVEIGGKDGWSVTIPGNRALATPAVVDGTVFVGGGFGSYEFYAFSAARGKPQWAVRVSDDGPTAAVVDDGYVAFNTESCTLFVLKAGTGEHVWSKWLGDPLMSQPAIQDGKILMAFPGRGGHRLVSFDLETGKEFWQTALAGDIISAPIIEGKHTYVATFDGTVYKYTLKDGREVWKKEMNATSAPWVDGDDIYVARRTGGEGGGKRREGVANLDSGGGKQKNAGLWGEREARYLDPEVQRNSSYNKAQKADDSSVGFSTGPATAKLGAAEGNIGQATVRGLWEFQGSRPTMVDGKLFVSFGDALTCIDPKTQKVVWERKLDGDLDSVGGHMATPPSAAGGRLYLGTADGWLLVYNQRDGSLVWKGNVGEPIRFQPAVAGGWVFVGTTSGNLIALDMEDRSADGWYMWGGAAGHNGK